MKRPNSIIEALDEIKGLRAGVDMPNASRLEAIRARAIGSLSPVRPLPSNSTLILLAIGGFIAFSALATIPVGFAGYHHLSLQQKLAYYAVILLAGMLLAATLVAEIIPGSKRRVTPGVPVGLALVSVALVAFALFPHPDFDRFTKLGLPCLELGTLCAAVSGFLAYLFLRKGFSSSPLRTAVATGLLAGLAGFAVLALHCPVQNIAHILVWHFGPMLIGAAAGALIALARPAQR